MRNKKRLHLLPERRFTNRKRSNANRKREELHQLDVKLNSRRGQRIRLCRRRAAIIKVAAIALTLLTVTAMVKWAYRQAFYENSEFRLDRLAVTTDGALSEADVATAAGVHMGMNLMNIDLKVVRERLEELPMVLGAEVHRELPDRLEIALEERQPIAWLSCPAQGVRPRNAARGFLIDQHGEIFRCEKLLKQYLELPVIETRDMAKPAEGGHLETLALRESIRLIQENQRLFGPDGLHITEVRVRNPYSLQCAYNTRMEVVFGIKEIDRGLKDLRWIVSHAHSAGQLLATVNVMPEKNIPVTFYTPPSLQAQPVEDLPLPEVLDARPGGAVGARLRPLINGG